jgi:hypothetical protein
VYSLQTIDILIGTVDLLGCLSRLVVINWNIVLFAWALNSIDKPHRHLNSDNLCSRIDQLVIEELVAKKCLLDILNVPFGGSLAVGHHEHIDTSVIHSSRGYFLGHIDRTGG